MALAGLGRLGLWLQTRRNSHSIPTRPAIPEGAGPLLMLHVARDAENSVKPVLRQLTSARPDLRIMRLSGDYLGLADDIRAARALIASAKPAALLLLGYDTPSAIVMAARQNGIPAFMSEVRLLGKSRGWGLRGSARRALLRCFDTIQVTDTASQTALMRMGADPSRIELTGPLAEIKDPPSCTEAERSAFAQLLNGRHAWLAADIPEAEEDAVLAAHFAAMRQSHRALLFLALRDPDRIDPLADKLETDGLIVARRTQDEEPTEEVHVMITDGATEMGLWYRLAPVTYLGGTLTGTDTATCHPFEPAALGSAIVHGPLLTQHLTQWQQLDGGNAARAVADATALAATMAELTQPDIIASLAGNAWTVSTGGADVARRIAAPILSVLAEEHA
ncbi:3-deoxy-D-manno-octulosonic acid transferase [Paracoccus sp. Z330]|uniref:3-deoxy-D-manno-octulosonic acid transferase n=1 Tax=Paracoccus onchidii TaxID=3017813 RepID=A0ABT4ZBW3_9RHOB|nr:glycosyltransferase N-terminal domain-containing protein [Paracoccus onchidii]MDB6176860.1 3-deoxy-D-manno-octulosonic acid transferase [Paracoccus onchidii]